MSGDLKKAESEYQQKVANNSALTNAELDGHNEFVKRFRADNPLWSRDIARVIDPESMPNPTGKVYRDDKILENKPSTTQAKSNESNKGVKGFSQSRPCAPHDVEMVHNPKKMPNPVGKVYKGDER